jgi:hypothetical protein
MIAQPMRNAFLRYLYTFQCIAGIPMAIRVGASEGWLGALFGFFVVLPVTMLVAYLMARRDTRPPVKSPPMTLVRGLKIALGTVVAFFALVGIIKGLMILFG